MSNLPARVPTHNGELVTLDELSAWLADAPNDEVGDLLAHVDELDHLLREARSRVLVELVEREEQTGVRKLLGKRWAIELDAPDKPGDVRAEELRRALLARQDELDLPTSAIDEAVPEVPQPPVVKSYVRGLKKLRGYGAAVSKMIDEHTNPATTKPTSARKVKLVELDEEA